MTKKLLTDQKFPFCPGCGHGVAVKNMSKALAELDYAPLDVVIVSDIGCSGLVDPLFSTHTIHGLHGRAPALGLGISLVLSEPEKKVVVIQGDGGVTIGLQHVLEAARRNSNMTLVVLNNQLYGMTGGQMSGLSTNEFKDYKHFPDTAPPFDVVELAHQAGAGFTSRVTDPKHIKDKLKQAFAYEGFALVEISSMCTSYAYKKMSDFQEILYEDTELHNDREKVESVYRETDTLFDEKEFLPATFESGIEGKVGVVIAGSAGGGVQSAAKLLANAGIMSGLYTTMKGEYPITVGTGFSAAEVIFSTQPIHYTGLEEPDFIIMVTQDGFQKVKNRVCKDTKIIADSSLMDAIEHEADLQPLLKSGGKKGAALKGVFHWVESTGLISRQAFLEAVGQHKYAEQLIKTIEQ